LINAGLCADFANLAPLAATIPNWCSAGHPIGKAYQAATYVLEYAFPRGHGASLVPAAYRIREAVDVVLAKRDERRRRDYPDAPTDVFLLRALWIERRPVRAIAADLVSEHAVLCAGARRQDAAGKPDRRRRCRNTLGEQPTERHPVWMHNADDDTQEIYRRVGAHCRRMNFSQSELKD
jgi:hypothetical protein